MAITDGHGLPISIGIASASPHETTLVEDAIENRFTKRKPKKLIGDRAYDADPLDERLWKEHRVELIAPHKVNRKKKQTQDGRILRRYVKRWKVERLFSWLQNYRRILVRYEWKAQNYLGFVQLGCILILLKYL